MLNITATSRTDLSTCSHTETEVAIQTCHLIQWQCTHTRPTSSNPDPIMPGVRQGSHQNSNFYVIIIIIIAFKGAIWDFLQSPHSATTVSNTHTQVAQAQPCANHVQHIEPWSRASVVLRATWYEGTAQLLSLTELKSHLSHLFELILLAESLKRWRRGGNRSTRRKTLATSFRKCHMLQPEDSSPKRDSNPRSSIGGRLGKQTC